MGREEVGGIKRLPCGGLLGGTLRASRVGVMRDRAVGSATALMFVLRDPCGFCSTTTSRSLWRNRRQGGGARTVVKGRARPGGVAGGKAEGAEIEREAGTLSPSRREPGDSPDESRNRARPAPTRATPSRQQWRPFGPRRCPTLFAAPHAARSPSCPHGGCYPRGLAGCKDLEKCKEERRWRSWRREVRRSGTNVAFCKAPVPSRPEQLAPPSLPSKGKIFLEVD